MIGVHFFKSPDICGMFSLLDLGDTLLHEWSVSDSYSMMVAHGHCRVNGVRDLIPPEDLWEIAAGESAQLEALADDTFVVFYFLTSELIADFPQLNASNYAGNWQRHLDKSWPGTTVTDADLLSLVLGSITADAAYRGRHNTP